jgi:hypothetical protein
MPEFTIIIEGMYGADKVSIKTFKNKDEAIAVFNYLTKVLECDWPISLIEDANVEVLRWEPK